jgi:hypothetical protein
MKLVTALAFSTLAAGCSGYMHLSPSGRLAPDDEIAWTQSYSACDTAGAAERSDPASPCVVSRRKPN